MIGVVDKNKMHSISDIKLSNDQAKIIEKIIEGDMAFLKSVVPIEKFKDYINSSSIKRKDQIIEFFEQGSPTIFLDDKENEIAMEFLRNKLKKTDGTKYKSSFFVKSDQEG